MMDFDEYSLYKQDMINKAVLSLISAMTYTGDFVMTDDVCSEFIRESAIAELTDSTAFVLETEGVPICVPETGNNGKPCWKENRCLNKACHFRKGVSE